MVDTSRRVRAMVAGVICATALAVSIVPLAAGAGAAPAALKADTMCPAAAGNARFVRFIFLSILGRCPESSASAYWTGKLNRGMSRFDFAETVDTTNENLVKNNAVPLFEELLGRAPTATETAAVVTHIRAYHEDGRIVAALLASHGYYSRVGGSTAASKDRNWLTRAYRGILDRDPDAAGRAHFARILRPGGTASTIDTRYRVASILERTNENARGWTAGVFFAGLNRPPNAAGFGYWVNWLTGPGHWQTFRLWTHILSSDEGYARAQTQPSFGPETAARSLDQVGRFSGR